MAAAQLYDIISVDNVRIHTRYFVLWPQRWTTCVWTGNWIIEQLDASKTRNIPTGPGIYTLLLQPNIASHPACSYLMYVGQSDSLRRRFGEYLRKERTVRSKMAEFLQKYSGFIYFCYVLIDGAELTRVEDNLTGAFIPPVNTKFKGELGRAIRAAF